MPLMAERGRLSREELLAELERAREKIAALEAYRWQSRERLIDSLAQHLQDGISVLSPEYVHLDVNPALCAMVGCEREELIGGGPPYPYWPPELQEQLALGLRRTLDGTIRREEATFMRKNGERFPVLITPSVIRDEVGEPVCVFAIIRDVSEQKRAEASIRDSEAHYRSLVENAPVGIFQSTVAGQLIYANSACATTFGCASPSEAIELVNRTGIAHAIYDDPATRRQLLQDVHDAGGEWIAFRGRLPHSDGSLHTGLIYACERRDVASGEVNLLGFVQDLTAQEQSEKALASSARVLQKGEGLARLGSWEWDLASGTCAVSEEWQRIHGLHGDVLPDDEISLTCHEDDRGAMKAALAAAAAGRPYRVDHRIVHPTTREVRHLMTRGEPFLDAEGQLARVIGASLDVTERVQADEVLREREERLQRALSATVTALGATVAMRDPYTAGHERRVAWLARRVAQRLGWCEEAVERVHTAALVHDVGKIAIPAEILSKPTRLTVAEFELVKTHADAGNDVLSSIDFGGPVAEIVRQHHERLDGSGYPQALHGDEILPGARVLAVADVVEAMVTHRPYRAALSFEQAFVEIGDTARYDAEAAAACRGLFEEEGLALQE